MMSNEEWDRALESLKPKLREAFEAVAGGAPAHVITIEATAETLSIFVAIAPVAALINGVLEGFQEFNEICMARAMAAATKGRSLVISKGSRIDG
jgi:hypothetical protein